MQIKNPNGLQFNFLANGSVQNIEVGPIRISLKSGTLFSKSGTNLYIRKLGNPITFIPMLGPESPSRFSVTNKKYIAIGDWNEINYTCELTLSDETLSWQWNVLLINNSAEAVKLDLVYMQDVGLKQVSDNLVNEYYVSQYLERILLDSPNFGKVVCCRQNMKEAGGNPWLMIAGKNPSASGSTDGMQFWGKLSRKTGLPQGLSERTLGGNYAGESPILALQEEPFVLNPHQNHQSSFVATFLPDHPHATSISDLERLPTLFSEFGQTFKEIENNRFQKPIKNLFNTCNFLPVNDLSSEEIDFFFGKEKRHEEFFDKKLISFFCQQNNHIVLNEKEMMVDRPHGHIIQAKSSFLPDENIVSTSCFAFGVFNSHLTQGNTNFNTLLSACTSQFNLSPESGQRIFIEIDSKKYLLSVPSAFEMGLNHCRWIYKHANSIFQIRTWSSKSKHCIYMDFQVIKGKSANLLITHEFDKLNQWKISPYNTQDIFIARPSSDSMIASKFPNAQFKINIHSQNTDYKSHGAQILFDNKNQIENQDIFILQVPNTSTFCMSFSGEIVSQNNDSGILSADYQFIEDCKLAQNLWKSLSLNLSFAGNQKDTAAIQEILPWYGMNALTHFLTPYGLEQFSGAAWGTRDVAQGPIDLLLTTEKYEEAKQVLRIIFRNQNPEGGWPQWWMFDSYAHIRAGDSHGDVVYWVIIALSDYIRITGDIDFLNEKLPYYHESGIEFAEKQSVSEHIDRLIIMIINSFIENTSLVPFGGGDWNDSLQPVSHELAKRLISSWTVEMNYQAFNQYKKVYEQTNPQKALELANICIKIKNDFNKYLIKDGIVAGYGLLEDDKSISVLLHPSDSKTGIKYSILPMDRGIISEIFTFEQAVFHQNLVEQHLKGPDGARLMDRPLKYQGGIQKIFQRAESSTFFGREIGLMYVHEHIRYAESLARMGRADAFLLALRQAIPVDYNQVVPCGDIRQRNCYYSSSDVTFTSRYEADERYADVIKGNLSLKGGWRIYSSGPGIYVSMVIVRLLGLRKEFEKIILDPVIPSSLDDLNVNLNFLNKNISLFYYPKEENFSPKLILINGKSIEFSLEQNLYRSGGAVIPENQFVSYLDAEINTIQIYL